MRDQQPCRRADQNPFLEWVPCDLCKREQYTVLHQSTYTVQDFSSNTSKSFMYASTDKARGNIVRCLFCSLTYMNPRDTDITAIYEAVGDDEYYVSSHDDRLATCERDLTALEQVAGGGRGKKLMDIGCSYGFFMDVAKQRGWDVYGCELSKFQYEEAAGRHTNVYNTELKKCAFPSGYFDALTLFDVIEHLPSPAAFLPDAYRVLKKGGVLCIITPDVESLPARLSGRYWLNFTRMHLYYFTPKTMQMLLEKNGFRVLKVARHKRVIKLGVAIIWMQKYPRIYRLLNCLVGNRYLKDTTVLSSLSGNMVVYAEKV